MIIPICEECGNLLNDYFDVEDGLCMDCKIDREEDPDREQEEE